ncbi:MAG TPA: PadR family transcriptional regulator [Gemmatimonadales bacterium]|jgi:transcriptional regulator|nr:PadR family transcriptional regulator [Gemmatimonadales bacterium]
MAPISKDRLRGTLDVLILKTLAWGPRHGYAVARWLEDTTADSLTIEEGSLYPSLYRMEQRGWIVSEWGISELGRQAKFYKLTSAGRKQLRAETADWKAFVEVVGGVLLADAP